MARRDLPLPEPFPEVVRALRIARASVEMNLATVARLEELIGSIDPRLAAALAPRKRARASRARKG